MTLGELFSQFFDRLAALWPFTIVAEWEQGVRLRNGHITALLTGGLHCYWPIIGEISTETATTRVVETDIQTNTSKDGASVTSSYGVKYRIKDLRQVFRRVDEFEDTVLELVRSTVGLLVPLMDWDDIVKNLASRVQQAVKARMHGWGIEIQEIAPITLTTAVAIRLLQESGE